MIYIRTCQFHLFLLFYLISEAIYRRFFFKNQRNPQSMMSDFEMAAANAFSAKFPEAEKRGCFFHFTHCVWRKIQKAPDVRRRYTEEADFALNLRMMLSLAFIRVETDSRF